MSEEILTGTAGNEAAQGYEPMISANPVKRPDDEKPTYSSNQFGIERAAKDLSDSREAEKPAARILLPFYL